MKTPITDKATANPIGFYSCATVPASTCREIEASRNELLEALIQCEKTLSAYVNHEPVEMCAIAEAALKAQSAIRKAKGN